MSRSGVSARSRLGRIAYASTAIAGFLISMAAVRAGINERLNGHYDQAITVLAAIEDSDSSVKDMLVASKGLLVNPDSSSEWEDARQATLQFRRSMAIVLRHSEDPGISARVQAIQADFNDILKTTGLRFKQLLKERSPETVSFYYREHYPRVQKLSAALREAKMLSKESAARWFDDKESLSHRIELINLLTLIFSLALLIYWIRMIGDSLSRELESISISVINSAGAVIGVSREMDSTAQILDGASRTQAILVQAAAHNIENVTSAAGTNATEADYGLARSAEVWFVTFGVKKNVADLLAAMQKLLASNSRMESVAGLLDELCKNEIFHAPGAREVLDRLNTVLAQVHEIILATRENIDLGKSLSVSCMENFESLNLALQLITDSVRSIDILSKSQRDEIMKIEAVMSRICDGTQRSAEVSGLVVGEASVLKQETSRLLESVERLKIMSLGA